MSMTGESALNDVHEEVCEGEGDGGILAREASDADRRTVADADQAGQPDTSCETKTT